MLKGLSRNRRRHNSVLTMALCIIHLGAHTDTPRYKDEGEGMDILY